MLPVEKNGDKQALDDKITKLKRDIKRLQMPRVCNMYAHASYFYDDLWLSYFVDKFLNFSALYSHLFLP